MRTHLFVLFLLAVATCATPKKIEAPVEKSEAPHPSFWDTAAYEELPESSDFSTRYGIVVFNTFDWSGRGIALPGNREESGYDSNTGGDMLTGDAESSNVISVIAEMHADPSKDFFTYEDRGGVMAVVFWSQPMILKCAVYSKKSLEMRIENRKKQGLGTLNEELALKYWPTDKK